MKPIFSLLVCALTAAPDERPQDTALDDESAPDSDDDEQLDERKRSLSRTPLARVVGQPGSPQTFTTPVSPSDEADVDGLPERQQDVAAGAAP